MKFSILVPTLNEEKYIGNLLNSLNSQTFKDFEVIIVDAKSEDRTIEVATPYTKSLDLKIITSPKRNISFQRNLAAKNAKSENLIFFDADVTLDKNFIAKVKHSLSQSQFHIGTSWLKPVSNKIIDHLVFGLFNHIYLETAKFFTPGGTGAFLYIHKTAFNHVRGFDNTTNFGEDFDIVKRIHQAGFKYHLFREPKVGFSVRRLDKEGRSFFYYKMIRSAVYYHTRGTIKDEKVYLKNEFGKF